MSSTGSTGLPPSILSGLAGGGSSALGESPAELITLPREIRNAARAQSRALKIRGEVVRTNSDDTVRVRTKHGDVDVKVDRRLERGAQVEIEIKADRGAKQAAQREASLRVVRQPPPEGSPRPAPSSRPEASRAPSGEMPQTATRQPQEPMTLQYKKPLAAQVRRGDGAGQSAPPHPQHGGLPPIGAIVRLSPLANATAITQPPFTHIIESTLPSALVSYTALSAPQAGINAAASAPPLGALSFIPQASGLPVSPISSSFSTAEAAAPPITTLAPNAQAVTIPTDAPTFKATAPPPEAGLTTSLIQHGRAVSSPLLLGDIDARIENITPPDISKGQPLKAVQNPPEQLITGNQRAESLLGVITGVSEGKAPALELFFPHTGEVRQFAFQGAAQDITIGTQVQVTPRALPSSAVDTLPPLPPLNIFGAASASWPAMNDLHQALAQIAPQAAQAMSALTPSPAQPAQLGPAMMFFIAAVRGGDLGSWMGDKATELLREGGGKKLLAKILQEGQGLTRIASETHSNDWRAVNIPLAWEGEIQKAALYYKHEGSHDDEATDGPKGTRFVFDLALDQMGPVQVDGLYRPISVDGKRLDLVVRTEHSFSEATRAEMRRVYASALRHTEVGGELSFQNQKSQWVSIDIAPDAGLGVSA